MRSVPRLCEFNPGICLTTEEKHGKTSVRVVKECLNDKDQVAGIHFVDSTGRSESGGEKKNSCCCRQSHLDRPPMA